MRTQALRGLRCWLLVLGLILPSRADAQGVWAVVARTGDQLAPGGVKPWVSINDIGDVALIVDRDPSAFTEDRVLRVSSTGDATTLADGFVNNGGVTVTHSGVRLSNTGRVMTVRSSSFMGRFIDILSVYGDSEPVQVMRSGLGEEFSSLILGAEDLNNADQAVGAGFRRPNDDRVLVTRDAVSRTVGGVGSDVSLADNGTIIGRTSSGSLVRYDFRLTSADVVLGGSDGFSAIGDFVISDDARAIAFIGTLSADGAAAANVRQADLSYSADPQRALAIPLLQAGTGLFVRVEITGLRNGQGQSVTSILVPVVYGGELSIEGGTPVSIGGVTPFGSTTTVLFSTGTVTTARVYRSTIDVGGGTVAPTVVFVSPPALQLQIGDVVAGLPGPIGEIRLDDSLSSAGESALWVRTSTNPPTEAVLRSEPTPPDATLVVVFIHGQVVAAIFDPAAPPPTWVRGALAVIRSKMNEVNARRQQGLPGGGPLGPVRLLTVAGEWSDLTHPGLKNICTSRGLWLLGVPNPVLIPFAIITEDAGRGAASAAARQAAARIAAQAAQAIESTRQALGPTHPILVDLVGHSRGGSMASAVLRRLGDAGALHNRTGVSLTLIDAIDLSVDEPDLLRPLARAGHLLADEVICQRGTERTSSFYAQVGLLAGEPSEFFPQSLVDWARGIGDTTLTALGYPVGHLRFAPYGGGFPSGDEVNLLVPGTSHDGVRAFLIDHDLPALVVGSAPAGNASLGNTTYFGQFIANPLLMPTDVVGGKSWSPLPSCGPTFRLASSGEAPVSFVADGSFTQAASTAASATALLSDPAVTAALIPELQFIADYLAELVENPAALGFGWLLSGSCVEISDSPGQPYIEFGCSPSNPGSITQTIDPDSVVEPKLKLQLDMMFLQQSGQIDIELFGPGMQFGRLIPAFESEVGRREQWTFIINRSPGVPGSLDELTIHASGIRLYSVDVLPVPPCGGDANGDNRVDGADLSVLLFMFGEQTTPFNGADFNGDGLVNGADLSVLLFRFGTAC